jgi:hypothetical protein
VSLRIGSRVVAGARVRITSGGLLAIGAMTGMILLGSAAIVEAARRAAARKRLS